MPYVMKRVMLKDERGNQRYERSNWVEHNGHLIELSGMPLYIYTPVWEDATHRPSLSTVKDKPLSDR